jgi:ubiquinone biosynthesis protein
MKPSRRITAALMARDALGSSPPPQLAPLSLADPRLAVFLNMPKPERVRVLTAMLDGDAGHQFRRELTQWIVQALNVERLVPQAYAEWRPVVREAMLFFGSHLSTPRLVPKVIEQLELAPGTLPEVRLLRLISRVPALQKLGQVIARNRHLHPSVKRELTRLENGMRDATINEIQKIIVQDLGPKLERYQVAIEGRIFSEASVSAVVRFTWYNPKRRQREHGVFKVLKPYVREYFAEEMDLLAGLAEHVGSRHAEYGFAERVLSDTFSDVRSLLQHEVRFGREQANLKEAVHLYRSEASIRIPQLIRPLCTSTLTALTLEAGEKITKAAARVPKWRRHRIARQLIEGVIGVPLLGLGKKALFHADPHAGNLLYSHPSGTLTLVDWALTAHINEGQRRQLAILFMMTLLRDQEGVCAAIEALSVGGRKRSSAQALIIRQQVRQYFEEQPLAHLPQAVDVMKVLERVAWNGVPLPSNLIMLRKAFFTLDGILHELAGPNAGIESAVAPRLLQEWLKSPTNVGWPLSVRDWLGVFWSAIFYAPRVVLEIMDKISANGRSSGVDRLLPVDHSTSAA